MADNAQDDEPTQRTPKGYEIPVPKREAVMKAFKKVMAPVNPEKRT
jgi:hypothetical protein